MSLRCDSSEAFPVGHKNAIRFPKTGSGLSRYFLLTRPGQPFGHIKGGTALHGVSVVINSTFSIISRPFVAFLAFGSHPLTIEILDY